MSALQLEAAAPATIALEALTRDPELQCRAAGVNKRTATEYAEAMAAGAAFPPVVVFVDAKGAHWLADGWHRVAAAELAGLAEVAADVRQGSRKDALLHAASANAAHGLRRTTADKRRSVLLVLAAYPKWSDRKVAEVAGVDNKTVAAARRSLKPREEIPHSPDDGPTSATSVTSAAPAPDDVEHLSKQLARVLAKWPHDRRGELRALLQSSLEAGLGEH